MVSIKNVIGFLRGLSLILIIIAGTAFFYKNILLTIILLFIGGIIYIFAKEIAKIIRGIIG